MNRRPARTLAVQLLVPLAALALVGCSAPSGSSGPSGGSRLSVVTTTTVLGDLISKVGGDLVTVTSLVPANADVHTFEPSPTDIRAVVGARLLVMNGLGLDDWLRDTIVNAAANATPLLQLGTDLPGVDPLPGEDPGTQNPHLWMSVPYAELYVDRIAAELSQVDAAHKNDYDRQAAAYKARLVTLDQHVRDQIATIPAANRRLVTFHDAFPYFAREYGIEIVGVAVEAPGQDPSAGEIAALIRAIKAAGVKAIFSESQFPTQLVDQIARETGATVVATLYDDALGDPPITSYEAVIQWDVDQLVQALR
jgi:ABC-type Zn uptake system ZnuABC Zn-binding protein ZnuA